MSDVQTRWANSINHLERVAIIQDLVATGPVAIDVVDPDLDEVRFDRAGRDAGVQPVYIDGQPGFAIEVGDLESRSLDEDPNDNCLRGMRCPVCGSLGSFEIEVTKRVTVYDDGTDDNGGDTEWDDNSSCSCNECEHSGVVREFRDTPICAKPESVRVLVFSSQDDGYELRVIVPAGIDIEDVKTKAAAWLEEARAIYRKDGEVMDGPFIDGTNDYKENDFILVLAEMGCIPIQEEFANIVWD